MDRKNLIWAIIFIAAGLYLVLRAVTGEGMAKQYVRVQEHEFVNVAEPDAEETDWVEVTTETSQEYDFQDAQRYPLDERVEWKTSSPVEPKEYYQAEQADPAQTAIRLSFWRTLGTWIAAFFTLAIFSFLYRDNPLYKIAEAVVVGVSAAYWMVVAFHSTLLPNLAGKISPEWVRSWAIPGLKEPQSLWYLAALALGVMLLWRLSPKGSWIARWPLAFFIGVFCGARLIAYLHGDFLNQIRNTIIPLAVFKIDPITGVVTDEFTLGGSIRNILLVGGVLAGLVYFFFSVEHKGVVGKTAKVGIWILMITFGAGFGYTVMGRIALLAIRLEFLFDEWLWLIDPTGSRTMPGGG